MNWGRMVRGIGSRGSGSGFGVQGKKIQNAKQRIEKMESGNRIRRAWVVILCLLITGWMYSQQAWGQYDDGDGSAEFPFQIAEPNQLIYMSEHPEDWDKCFILTADINMNLADPNAFTTALIAPDIDNGTSGFQGTEFTGTFNGNSHIVHNLTIDTNDAGNDYLGMFGQTGPTSQMLNLGLENVNITCGDNSSNLGGICGYNSGDISNCYVTGSFTGSVRSGVFGGLCGTNSGDITNCHTAGSITGGRTSGPLGGLCGKNEEGTITNCYTTVSVSSGRSSDNLGGLCGVIEGGCISNCYATGSISCEHDANQIGGLCGINMTGGIITNCYSSGSVIGGDVSEKIGGLCGINSNGIINECYSAGYITGGYSSQYLGGLCGYNSDDITNCYATSSVASENNARYLGGLCGKNIGEITYCYAKGSVTGENSSAYLGGLCGENQRIIYHGIINNCYATGSVTGGDDSYRLGGLCGYKSSGSIRNCYFLDTAGPDNGLGTPLDDPNMRIQSNFVGWDFDPNDGDPADWYMSLMNYPRLFWQLKVAYFGQTKISLAQGDSDSIQIVVYCQVDETLSWTITGYESCPWITSLDPNSGVTTNPTDLTTVTIDIDTTTLTYGYHVCELILTSDDGDNVIIFICLHVTLRGYGTQVYPFLIENFEGIQEFANPSNSALYWSSGIFTHLECDLDLNPNLTGRQIYTNAVIAPDTNISNFEYDGMPYNGVFEGNGNTISNLTIAGNDYLGLFGYMKNGDIQNLYLEKTYITGDSYLGILCGCNSNGNISNCYVTGSVSGGNNSDYLGGLCGYNSGDISNCYTFVSVNGGYNTNRLGGMCGYNNYSIINQCYSAGYVTGGNSSKYLGGLCGYNTFSGIINECYSTGYVTGGYSSKYLGGLCGYNRYNIINCFATGLVSGGIDSEYLGGLCGSNLSGGSISICYSTGSVTGDNNLGGLCGYSDGSISTCYYLDTTGPDNGYGEPLDDPNMRVQGSFVDWDFVGDDNGSEDHWQMCIDGYDYPRLRWEFVNPADFLYPGRVDIYDLFIFTQDWLSTDSRCCDIAPVGRLDDIVNLLDYIEFSRHWLEE